jgi:CubicO group peptidase (beta-lactamase class C family)
VFDELVREASERMEAAGVPGAAVGVLYEAKVEAAGLGVTNVEHPLDVDEDTLFQIGSITKTFVGTAVMRLVERGEVELDAPLRTYLPDLRLADVDATERATMRHLLTHTGGWVGDYFDDLGAGDDALARMVAAMAELPQVTPLGAVWSYNNAGFYLAGRVLEHVTGKTFETAVRNLVLEPLGLERTVFFPDEVMTHRFAAGHVEDDDGKTIVARPWPIGRAAHAAGGLISTVPELLRYARFHLGDGTAEDGERLLTRESLELMRTPQVSLTEAERIGITWMLNRRGDRETAGHGGGTNGQISLLTLVPDSGLAVAVVTNHNRGGEVALAITNRALREYAGVDEPDPERLPRSEPELAEYAGRYTAALADYELTPGDGVLVAAVTPKGGFPKRDSPPLPAPPPAPLAFYGDDLVFVPEGRWKGAKGQFLRDDDGRIGWLRLGGRIHRRVQAGAESNPTRARRE